MIEHSDLSFPVYQQLKKMILNGELKPGEKLLQEKLAQNLGISRTPLLKALQMLEFDYLVESIPRRGMFVKKLTEKEMMDIYDVREGIESVAVRLVTERIKSDQLETLRSLWEPFADKEDIDANEYRKVDEQFHALLLDYSQNEILNKTYSQSLIKGRIIQMGLQRPPKETIQEHLDLVAAIADGNANRAEKIIKHHIRKSKQLIVKNLKRLETSER